MEKLFDGFPLAFIVFFLVMWVGIVKIVSFVSGWNILTKLYKKQDEFTGKKWHFQSLSSNSANYSGCVTFGANNEDMFIGVLFPFRVGHPDLVIPLREITGKEYKAMFLGISIYENVKLTFTREPSICFTITKKLANKIEEESNGVWKYLRG